MNHQNNLSSLKREPPLVIHVLTSLDFGGVERHMEVIASVLNHARMRHRFIALGRGGATEEQLRSLGAEVLCLGQKVAIPSYGALKALLKLFRRETLSVVHAHGAEANFHALLAAWLARVPVRVGEEIGIPNHSNKAKHIFRLVFKTAHCVIGVSQVVTEWLIASREAPSHKARRIDNPVHLPPVKVESKPDHWLRIIFVGRLEPVKNPLCLLQGVSRLVADGITAELWIVGDGSERPMLEKSAMEMNLGEQVSFFGFQKHPEDYLYQSHLLVQPSLSEGFSLGLVEAMACGLPVISTTVGSAPDIVQPGKTGWLLPEPAPEQIAAALKEAWRLGPEALREMGLRARESVEGRFDPLHYLEQIEALYEQLAGQSGA